MISSATHGYLRPSVEDLESHLLASRRIREFLKSFSATQWPRVVKATLMLGIQELEKRSVMLSAKDIEDAVVQNEQVQVKKERKEKKQRVPLQEVESVQKEIPSAQPSTKAINSPVASQTSSQPNYKFRNTFKEAADISSQASNQKQLGTQREATTQRRRDQQQSHQQIFFDTHRSSSVPAVLSAHPTERFNTRQKPASEWRTPAVSNFQRNGSRPANRMFNEDALSDHHQQLAKRSKSLNPLIYPDWWGGYEESITAQIIDVSQHENRQWHKKPATRRQENNSLDRRLQEAKEAAAQLERMFAENNRQYLVEDNNSRKRARFQEAQEQYQEPHQYQTERIQNYGQLQEYPEQHYSQPMDQNERRYSQKENYAPNARDNSRERSGLLQQHSPPKHCQKSKTQRSNGNKSSQRSSQRPIASAKSRQQAFAYQIQQDQKIQNKGVPGYLKYVESRIKDRVQYDKERCTSNGAKPIEIFVKDKPIKNKPNQPLRPMSTRNTETFVSERGQVKVSLRRPQTGQDLSISTPQYDERYTNVRGDQNINIAEIADGFLSSPLMTQFSSEIAAPGSHEVKQQYQRNGYQNQSSNYIDSPGTEPIPHYGEGGSRPQTMNLSNYMQAAPNHNGGGHYYNEKPYGGGVSSVNTTSHNLCTTTNNTMMMYPPQQYEGHYNRDHNLIQPMIMVNNNNNSRAYQSGTTQQHYLSNDRVLRQPMHNEDDSGFYSQNDYVLTNSHNNTPNAVNKQGMTHMLNNMTSQQYNDGEIDLQRATYGAPRDYYSSAMNGTYQQTQSHNRGENPFQTKNYNPSFTRQQPAAFNYAPKATTGPQNRLEIVNSAFHSSVGSFNQAYQEQQPPREMENRIHSPMSEDPNAFSQRQYGQQHRTSARDQYDSRANYTIDGLPTRQGGPPVGMTQVLKREQQQQHESESEGGNDERSESSLSNYTRTEDIRNMFAKTPAGVAELQHRQNSTLHLQQVPIDNQEVEGLRNRDILRQEPSAKNISLKPNQYQLLTDKHLAQLEDLKALAQNDSDQVTSPSNNSQNAYHQQQVALKNILQKPAQVLGAAPISQRLQSKSVHGVSASSYGSESSDSSSEEEGPAKKYQPGQNSTSQDEEDDDENPSYFTSSELSQSEDSQMQHHRRKSSQGVKPGYPAAAMGYQQPGQFSFHQNSQVYQQQQRQHMQ